MSAATMERDNAYVERKLTNLKNLKADMIARVKDMPADGLTRIIPGHGIRGMHCPATPFACECAYAQISETSALRSRKVRGKWMPREEVWFSESEWGKVVLGSGWSL